ncbi:putative sulfate exporter family transporter, partial [Staphylococcus aureus]|uniref:putative sulfate exporter family transporter n=1 Tax=Staphylococcus aureus TaxID=1280 RepID=UPI003260CC21
ETLALTSNYLKVMFLSAPFVILFFILEQFARAIGAPMVSMIGLSLTFIVALFSFLAAKLPILDKVGALTIAILIAILYRHF